MGAVRVSGLVDSGVNGVTGYVSLTFRIEDKNNVTIELPPSVASLVVTGMKAHISAAQRVETDEPRRLQIIDVDDFAVIPYARKEGGALLHFGTVLGFDFALSVTKYQGARLAQRIQTAKAPPITLVG